MKTSRKIKAVVASAVIMMGIAACGVGPDGPQGGSSVSQQPSTVTVAKGSVATDSWGYTETAPVSLTAPATTAVVVKERTLLADANNAAVAGTVATKISYSADLTNLSAAAQLSAPGVLVCYLNVEIGSAKTASPSLTASVDAGSIPAEQTVSIYRFDTATGKWISPQAALATGGRITFQAPEMGLYGVFK